MAWLERNLAAAAQANQKVWLMFHIPPGIDGYASAMKHQTQVRSGEADNATACGNAIVPMWVPAWTAQFDTLLARYHSTVVAGFAGHTHSDDFRLIGDEGKERRFILINPAISPVYQQNPGFRVVSYRSNGTVTDQSTYYLTNLKSASNKLKGRWKREYTFTRKWKTRELNAASLGRLYSEVTESDEVSRSMAEDVCGFRARRSLGEEHSRGLYCAVESLTLESYKACYCAATPNP